MGGGDLGVRMGRPAAGRVRGGGGGRAPCLHGSNGQLWVVLTAAVMGDGLGWMAHADQARGPLPCRRRGYRIPPTNTGWWTPSAAPDGRAPCANDWARGVWASAPPLSPPGPPAHAVVGWSMYFVRFHQTTAAASPPPPSPRQTATGMRWLRRHHGGATPPAAPRPPHRWGPRRPLPMAPRRRPPAGTLTEMPPFPLFPPRTEGAPPTNPPPPPPSPPPPPQPPSPPPPPPPRPHARSEDVGGIENEKEKKKHTAQPGHLPTPSMQTGIWSHRRAGEAGAVPPPAPSGQGSGSTVEPADCP